VHAHLSRPICNCTHYSAGVARVCGVGALHTIVADDKHDDDDDNDNNDVNVDTDADINDGDDVDVD
jgi:hypothetical protein